MKLRVVNPFPRLWANTDNITKWVQVAALVVAGYWTYTRFIKVDAPSLEPVARVEYQGPYFAPHDDLCRVKMGIVIHNEGHTSFDVGRVQVQGWQRAPVPQSIGGSPAYFDVRNMRKGVQMLDVQSLPNSFLNRRYPPRSQYDQSFTWDFGRISPLWMFEVTVYDKKNKLLGNVRQWGDGGCGK
jgi:hypothetical protein